MDEVPAELLGSPLISDLSSIRKTDLRLAGGKGANLGELLSSGFSVPPGFVITTAAYSLVLNTGGLQARVLELLDSLDAGNPESIAGIGGRISGEVQRTPVPERVRAEVLSAYRRLGGDAVAVRSSATAEDLPGAAFAGQQDSFLNVVGEEAVLEAIRGCWASLWSERAITYRELMHVDHAAVKMAVVVQKMVNPEAAGVMFTANPVSGARNEVVIDANPGLGEAVVSGLVTPDHYVLEKRFHRVKEMTPGRRELTIQSESGGGTAPSAVSGSRAGDAALPLHAVRRLSRAGTSIERRFGVPQDIEWAWVRNGTGKGRIAILQARPMTALPEPLEVGGVMRRIVPMLAEMWPERPYPLDMTTFTGAIERAVGVFLESMIGRSAPRPDEAFREDDGVVVQFVPPRLQFSPDMFTRPWIALWRTRENDPALWEADPAVSEVIEKARALECRDVQRLSWEESLRLLHEALDVIPQAMELRIRYFPQAVLGLAFTGLFLVLTGAAARFGELLSGVRTRTTETNEALEDLAACIRADPGLREVFHRADTGRIMTAIYTAEEHADFRRRFEAFLAVYGHRETTLTVSQPAWKDKPETVLEILELLAESAETRAERYETWRRTRDEVLSNPLFRIRVFRRMFETSLVRARCLVQIREDTHFIATMVQPVLRRIALELGRRLVEAGALTEDRQVFHLRLEDLESIARIRPLSEPAITEIRALVARRTAGRESLRGRPVVDPRLRAAAIRKTMGGNILLRGAPGSPGYARGPVRIVHDAAEFGKLKAGDVLVSPVTNPAWTPLFRRAAAVVVDSGGAASHAAIVAREYGVPAVMGTVNGTELLHDGQQVYVDGSRGLVLKTEET